jgi:catechol 2,3-dioxygenase-like lactoylglutathione lyase family enzyme
LATTKSTKFNVRGINHLALVVSDMEKTTNFYRDVLGMPLVRTAELPGGGQQFYFKVSDNTMLSACWYPDAPDHQPGFSTGGWNGYNEETGQQNRGTSFGSASGSMHHLAFDIPLEKQEEYKDRLRAAGVPCTEVNHHILYGADGKQVQYPYQVPTEAEAVDEFINSIYFPDPDGRTFEFAAYVRPLVPDDVKHTPGRARAVEDEVEVTARRSAQPRERAAGA